MAHTGIIQFPMRKGWKRVHRLVVLPDFQGVGIGVRFIDAVADIVTGDGNDLNLTTTTPALVAALKRSTRWALVRRGVAKLGDLHKRGQKNTKGRSQSLAHLAGASSDRRPTFSFNFRRANT